MTLNPIAIRARDLPDAWFQALDVMLEHGRVYTVDHGSYAGSKRMQLDYVTIHITHPQTPPFIPEMPPHLSHIPPPTTIEYVVNDYLPYLMIFNPRKKNEQYTYAERIAPQMNTIIKRYIEHGLGSNQECISVAQPSDLDLDDPPCLRQIDTNVTSVNGVDKLHFYLYFRSWDLWGGFPANLAAIAMMQGFMAECINVEPGDIIATSKGLHIYDFCFDLAKLRVG